MKKLLSLFTALALVLALGIFLPEGALVACAEGSSGYLPEGFEFSGRIVLVGDSTVADYPESMTSTRGIYGWGMKLEEKLEKVTVLNYAVGGASTRNYYPLPQYTQLKNTLDKGDYLFIQFGHNDEAVGTSRGTYPNLDADTLDEEGKDAQGRYSYEFLLMKYYIQLARDKGAVPVLITPISSLGKDGQPYYTRHTDYQNAMKKVGSENNIAVIDMTAKTAALYNELYQNGGAEATRKLHCYTDSTRTVIDQSHLSEYGASEIASMIAKEAKALGLLGSNSQQVTDCAHTNTYTANENIIQPTCIKSGSFEEVEYCSDCGVELSRVLHVTKAKGHDFSANIRYEWSDDGKSCTGYGTCTCRAYTYEKAAVTSAVKTPATETAMGVTTYTATFTNKPFTTQTKDVADIPMLTPARIPGDANGDKSVDVKDITTINQYIAHWNVTINLKNADVNGDGDVTVKDVTLLKQHLAKWKVELK